MPNQVSTHASVRRRPREAGYYAEELEVSTHASVRRRRKWIALYGCVRQFQLTPP